MASSARSISRDRVARLAGGGVLLIVLIFIALTAFGSSTNHYLYAGFDNAIQMTPGQQVRVAGRPVGEISNIRLDKQSGTAVVTLDITSNTAWPLPRGSYAVAHWGSTTAYLGRYTEIVPGPKGNPPLPDWGILTPQQDQSAFELDQSFDMFRGQTAGQTQELLNRLGDTLQTEGPALRRGLAAAPSGLNQAANLLGSISANEYDLSTLAQAGDRTLTTLDQQSGQLQSLVASAAGTFTSFAAHTAAEQQALSEASPAFAAARGTFGKLDTSLGDLTTLVDNIRPGAPLLVSLAGSAARTVATLRKVAPQATATLNYGVAAAPKLTSLFDAGDNLFPAATKAIATFAPMFACIRAYAPDIAGFLTDWSGFTSHYDAGGHYARAFELTVIPALYPGTLLNSEEALKLSPGLSYAFPRPPGLNEGHPYFMPQCGITKAALNPADDPEGAGKDQ
jgi:phospholipid/cholesterol/gamma-HCH transport system substrate-binding protein